MSGAENCQPADFVLGRNDANHSFRREPSEAAAIVLARCWLIFPCPPVRTASRTPHAAAAGGVQHFFARKTTPPGRLSDTDCNALGSAADRPAVLALWLASQSRKGPGCEIDGPEQPVRMDEERSPIRNWTDRGRARQQPPLFPLILQSYARYYNMWRTHRLLDKDAPTHRMIERFGVVAARPVLGGLHHRYCRIQIFGTHRQSGDH